MRYAVHVALMLIVPAAAADLRGILEAAGRRTLELSTQLSAVTCVEAVTQYKVDAKGKELARRETTFDYLMMLQSSGSELTVEESRIEKGRREKRSGASLLTSEGFSVLALIFHPQYQPGFEFTDLGAAVVDKVAARRLAFKHIPGERSPSALVLKGREFPIGWQGIATIRENTWEILRIEARLPEAMADLGLLQLSADVTYAPVRFSTESGEYWLPRNATLHAATKRQRWRNEHRFSAYRRFNVETTVSTPGGD